MLRTASPHKRLRILPLAAVIFLTVSGGPYGLEPLLSYGGKHGALLILMLTPLLWDIPTIFIVMELNSMMPVTGGYYQWVKRALGIRWAWYEGWWTWLYTFVDLAIYPVLFVQYASFLFPEIAQYKIPICFAIIWTGAGLNILGIVPVGRISMILSVTVVLPFLILFAINLSNQSSSFHLPSLSLKGLGYSSIGMGLYTVMWNFIGWDNTTTYAEEVNKPVKTYLLSTFIAFGLTLFIYLVAVVTAISSGMDLSILGDEGFPMLGSVVAGQWLAVILAAGGMASALGLFCAVLLSVSRVPKVMADDQLLPQKLQTLHPRYRSPYISIIVCASVVSVMILWTFGDLVIIDVTLYGAALFLEFVSLIIFRIKLPHATRPFKIPLNITGLCLLVLLPISVYCIALTSAFSIEGRMLKPALFALGALLSAEVIWRVIVWRKKT
ncbi:MAG TPA: APC family permease [Chitinophagaceae bacterium]|jgi:amino acid transporter|nr:APC family permease [Chitinophagaceae bacterium]